MKINKRDNDKTVQSLTEVDGCEGGDAARIDSSGAAARIDSSGDGA